MKLIDMHVHLSMEHTDEQVAAYVKQKQDEGMLKVLLIGPGPKDGQAAHERLIEVCGQHEGFFIPFPRVDLTSPDEIDVQALFDMGCVGLKFIGPYEDYDHECFLPAYAKAEELAMPVLFHTGILGSSGNEPRGIRGTSSARMKPEHLDTIARAFPDLIIQGAHLGNPWYEMALEVMRYNRNLYWDICGTTLTKKMTADWFMRIQWERESRKQFLYATDEHPILPEAGAASHYTTGLEAHVQFLDRIGWTEEEKEGYFYKNGLDILERTYKKQNRPFKV
ncbi:amidohydrolase family protein [Planctomycetota bacterium]